MKTGRTLSPRRLSQIWPFLLVQTEALVLGKALDTRRGACWVALNERGGHMPPILALDMDSRRARRGLRGFNRTGGVGETGSARTLG